MARQLGRIGGRFGKEAFIAGLKLGKHGQRQYAKSTDLFPQRLVLPDDHGYVPTLSPLQVTSLLSVNETSLENKTNSILHEIKGYESNQLGSNFPCEDRRRQARLTHSRGTLYAVFDGHGGLACAQAVSERLFEYIAVSLLSAEKLEEYSHSLKTDSGMELLHWHYNNNDYSNEEMSTLHRNSLYKYVIGNLSTSGLQDYESEEEMIGHALQSAFVQLDSDMSAEALPSGGSLNLEALEVGLSGACATVAHIRDLNVHVASLGDTRAVLGQVDENGNWVAKPLTTDHTVNCPDEVERIKGSHPTSEHNFVIKNNRLLGQLIPTRAFGDFRFKWSNQDLKNIIKILDNPYAQNLVPMNYYTPPYLLNVPDVIHHKLTPNDRFLVLASDGLWDMLSNDDAIRLVGEFIEGKETDEKFRLQDRNLAIGQINDLLQKRKQGLANKSTDQNAATHLIRNALGKEHRKISEMLTITPEVVRYYRDDITVTVIFFDSRYIGEKSGE